LQRNLVPDVSPVPVVVGNAGRLMTMQQSLAPGLNERMLATMVDRQHLEDLPAPPTSGSLFSPMGRGASIEGGWRSPNGSSKTRKLATALVVGISAALVLGAVLEGDGRQVARGGVAFS
jgi:hypothetical protein